MKATTKAKTSMKTTKKTMKKAKTSMKTTKKAMKKSKVAKGRGAKARVFLGTKERTSGGLKKSDLTKNRDGKVVSKRASDRAKKTGKHIAKFGKAVAQARKSLGIKGFVPVGGKTARGQALLKKARSLYKK